MLLSLVLLLQLKESVVTNSLPKFCVSNTASWKGTPPLVTFKVIINIKNSECIQELKWLLCWGFQKAAKASSLLYWMKFIVRGVTYIAYSSIQMSQASDHQILQVAHCLPFSMENRKKIFILGRSFAHYWAPRNNWLMCVFFCVHPFQKFPPRVKLLWELVRNQNFESPRSSRTVQRNYISSKEVSLWPQLFNFKLGEADRIASLIWYGLPRTSPATATKRWHLGTSTAVSNRSARRPGQKMHLWHLPRQCHDWGYLM